MYLTAVFLFLLNQSILIRGRGKLQSDIRFLAEPQNITTAEGLTVFIPCSFGGTDAAPSWNIEYKNRTTFTISSSDLPPKHLYNGTGIVLQDVDDTFDEITYVCYLAFADTFENGRINFKTLVSTPGTVHVIGKDNASLQRIVISKCTILRSVYLT